MITPGTVRIGPHHWYRTTACPAPLAIDGHAYRRRTRRRRP